MSIQMVNPNFHNIDLGNYNGGGQQSTNQNNFNNQNGMMLNQQQMQQHVVPQHLNSNNHQLLRNVPDGQQYSTGSPSTLNLTSNKSSTNTPQITHLQASPANLTNSPSAISSPITISNNSSLNSPSTSSCSPSLLLNGTSNKRIMISQQTCLVEEKFSKNGVQKNVHVVVKNNPFLLTLSLLDSSLNFHQLTPEVQLVYDSESLKEVDSATVKPLEYKTRANEEGDQLTIELRIKVLSSQLEDMLFRAKVKIVDPRTRKETHGLSVITHPIRVVSKPDQVKKKAKKRKRAPTDSLMDTLNRIEHQQKEQQRLLKKLCYHDKENNINSLLQQQQNNNLLASTNNNNNTTTTTTTCNNNNNNIDDSTAIVKIEKQNDTIDCNNTNSEIVSGDDTSASSSIIKPILNGKDEFQSAFKEFIGAFKQLQCLDPDGADGAFKINTCANDAQTMCEILEMVKVELKKDENFKNKCNGNASGNACGENDPDNPCSCKVCPYKQKVDHINQSYETYFNMFNPSNTTNSVVPQSQMIGNQQQAQQQQIDYSAYIDPTQIQAQQAQQVQLQAQQQLQMQQQYMQQQAQQAQQQQTMDQQQAQQQQQQYYLQQYHIQQQQQQQRYLMQQQQYIQQQQQQSNSANSGVVQQQPNQQQQLDFQNQNNFIDFNSGLNFMNFSNIGFNSGLGDIGFS